MNTHDLIVAWIQHILETRRWTPTDLARAANLSPSTITRRLTGEQTFVPTMKTLGKIRDGAGMPIPAELSAALMSPRPQGKPPRDLLAMWVAAYEAGSTSAYAEVYSETVAYLNGGSDG